MRAISVQVGDSSGVLRLLQPGHRVDVQTVYTRDSSQEMQLRTILENVPVLEVDLAPEKAPGKPTLPVVTLLTSPGDADTLALADSAAHVRLLLRNVGDKAVGNRSSLAFGSVLRGGTPAPSRAVRKSSAPLVPVAPAPACEPKTPLSPATPTVQ
jgi:Flp pilus assembly protein CpaB